MEHTRIVVNETCLINANSTNRGRGNQAIRTEESFVSTKDKEDTSSCDRSGVSMDAMHHCNLRFTAQFST
jgi:hypothetical protein